MQTKKRIFISLFILLLIKAGTVFADDAYFHVRTIPSPFWKNAAEWKTPLPISELMEASLVASGLQGNNLNTYKLKFNLLIKQFKENELPKLMHQGKRERGEAVLTWMHTHLLHQYQFEQTFMNVLIDRGTFNCVSSSILYIILARESGLDTEGIETHDHVFCRVKTGQSWIDVETTSPYGFNPGEKKKFVNSFKQTGFTYVPPGHYAYRKKAADKEMIALILQNRMALLQKQKRYASITGLAVDRWTLTGKKKHFEDMNNAFRNWAAVLNNRHEYLRALHFMVAVSKEYNLQKENRKLIYALAYNNLIALLDKKDYSGARNFLTKEEAVLYPEDMISLKKVLFKNTLASTAQEKPFNESTTQVQSAYTAGILTRDEWEKYITFLYRKKAVELQKTSGYYASWEFLSSTPEEIRNLVNIASLRSIMHHNWTAKIHNMFIEKIQKKDIASAKKILTTSLAEDPDNRILRKDLTQLENIEKTENR